MVAAQAARSVLEVFAKLEAGPTAPNEGDPFVWTHDHEGESTPLYKDHHYDGSASCLSAAQGTSTPKMGGKPKDVIPPIRTGDE